MCLTILVWKRNLILAYKKLEKMLFVTFVYRLNSRENFMLIE